MNAVIAISSLHDPALCYLLYFYVNGTFPYQKFTCCLGIRELCICVSAYITKFVIQVTIPHERSVDGFTYIILLSKF